MSAPLRPLTETIGPQVLPIVQRLNGGRFLVVGRAGMDLYAHPPGSNIDSAASFTAALGGSAANIAVAIAQQGVFSSLLTAVSDDAVGRYTTKELARYGVDTSHVKVAGSEARNSLAVVETRSTNCQSVIYRNGAADFELSAREAAGVDYGKFSALIVTGTALARNPSRKATLKALERARAAGLVCIIDVDYRPYSWTSMGEAQAVCADAAALCDIIVGNDEEFGVLAKDHHGIACAAALAAKPERIIIYKMGEKGCTSFADGSRFDMPIYPVVALKPTGAGDGFMGGLLSGLVAGWSLQDSVRRGAATAAIVVTRVGCAPAMPRTEEVLAFMQHHRN